MHFLKFHPEVASCLLSRGKRKNAPLGMRLLWKYIRNYFLVYHLISHFLLYLQNYKEFEAEILDLGLQSEKYGLSFDIKNIHILLPLGPWGDENVIGIRTFNIKFQLELNTRTCIQSSGSILRIAHLDLEILDAKRTIQRFTKNYSARRYGYKKTHPSPLPSTAFLNSVFLISWLTLDIRVHQMPLISTHIFAPSLKVCHLSR